MSKLDLLYKYQQKACCHHSYRQAIKIWRELEPLLNEDESSRLRLGVNHHEYGEGRGEFDGVCNDIKKKWKGDEFRVSDISIKANPANPHAVIKKAWNG